MRQMQGVSELPPWAGAGPGERASRSRQVPGLEAADLVGEGPPQDQGQLGPAVAVVGQGGAGGYGRPPHCAAAAVHPGEAKVLDPGDQGAPRDPVQPRRKPGRQGPGETADGAGPGVPDRVGLAIGSRVDVRQGRGQGSLAQGGRIDPRQQGPAQVGCIPDPRPALEAEIQVGGDHQRDPLGHGPGGIGNQGCVVRVMANAHVSTPMALRSLARARRNRDLTVPSGTSSARPTSAWLRPSK